MTDHVNLEIRLDHHPEADHYEVKLSRREPGSDAPIEEPGEVVVVFDLEGLEEKWLAADYDAYGKKLAACLKGHEKVAEHFSKARQAAKAMEQPLLRLRLRIEPGARELDKLCWELLRDLEEPESLLTIDENTPFTRHVPSADERRVCPRPYSSVKALVVIANPSNVSDYPAEGGLHLAPVPVEKEWERAQEALGTIPATLLCSDATLNPVGRPTLVEMLAHLRRKDHDILYLVAHGALLEEENPQLWLEDEEGKAHVVYAKDTTNQYGYQVDGLVKQLGTLQSLPRLAVLASCESAAARSRDTGAWSALGPRLVRLGVPAVIAMQGSVSMTTVEKFMPTLFRELRHDGQIDRAMAVARHEVREAGRLDWWMPILLSRLDENLLFSPHGWVVGEEGEDFWDGLVKNVRRGWCTPFLGPGVTDDFLPRPADVARSLAEKPAFIWGSSEDLARVAQFYVVYDQTGLSADVIEALTEGFVEKMQGLGLTTAPGGPGLSLSDTIKAADWSKRAQEHYESEIHHQLADFGLPLYVTTNCDNFMTLALRARGRDQARRVALDWEEKVSQKGGEPKWDLDPPPSDSEPVVLHLFGTDKDLPLMVLAEDHFLDYLARVFHDPDALLPSCLNSALATTSLVFLGYDLFDPAFKVILRGLLANVNLDRWGKQHVAVQLDPSVVGKTHRDKVIKYLEKYFSDVTGRLDVYWGGPHEFVDELHRRWQKKEGGHG